MKSPWSKCSLAFVCFPKHAVSHEWKKKSTKISFWCLLWLISGIFGATHGLIHIRCTKKENHTGLKMRLKMCNFLCLLQQTAWIMKCFGFFFKSVFFCCQFQLQKVVFVVVLKLWHEGWRKTPVTFWDPYRLHNDEKKGRTRKWVKEGAVEYW